MKITSTSITEGQPIELAYAHADAGGKNISPQLSWTPVSYTHLTLPTKA